LPQGHGVKQISQSLVAQHRNRNLIGVGGKANKQLESVGSIGLNSKFRDSSHQPAMQSIVHNPMDEEQDRFEEQVSKTAKKHENIQSDNPLLS